MDLIVACCGPGVGEGLGGRHGGASGSLWALSINLRGRAEVSLPNLLLGVRNSVPGSRTRKILKEAGDLVVHFH